MRLYELDIDGETTEVYFNSIVNVPAHMKAALKFNEQEAPKRFAFNEELQLMTGVMVAVDEPIYRYDRESKEEFNVVFRKSVADKIIRDYMAKGYANRLNFDHNDNALFKSAYLMEIYQVDESRGNSVPDAFKSQNIKDGSIIATYHITDPQEWAEAKQRGGFSIEGEFELVEVLTKNQEQMSLLEKLGFAKKDEVKQNKETFAAKAEKFGEATLEDGTVIYWDGDLNEGTAIFVDVEGVLTPAPDGAHVTSEGLIIETVEGVATNVSMPTKAEEPSQEFATVTEVAEAFAAFEAKLMEAFSAKLSEVEQKFTAQLSTKEAEFKALSEKFEALKKAAPAPTREKFSTPKPEKKEGKLDLLKIVK
jgi:hypothetical protein